MLPPRDAELAFEVTKVNDTYQSGGAGSHVGAGKGAILRDTDKDGHGLHFEYWQWDKRAGGIDPVKQEAD